MRIKKAIKRIGKHFISLRQDTERIIQQTVLVADNGYSSISQIKLAIEKVKDYFPKAEIWVLTFQQRRSILEKEVVGLNYILPFPPLRAKRYQIALEMFKIKNKRYDAVILLSLDITPIIVSLLFMWSKVILYNQWHQWWSLRLRKPIEIFKPGYIKKKSPFSFKNFLKRTGLFFVLLREEDTAVLRHSILIVNNGYASSNQLIGAVHRIKESLPQSKILLLGFKEMVELKNRFPDLKFQEPLNFIPLGIQITRRMFKLRNNRYDYVILLSLDVLPIIMSIVFMRTKIILYNQWHQWWVLKSKSIKDYLTLLIQGILSFIIFIYLLIYLSFASLQRIFNILRFGILK